ncbi:hypothetical protein AGOR_G00016120 [Albula goreensis]|uniref:Optineurin n=1 Tax=Albula goreensis TaxID=1534307 RepID=A0A8T3E801_9TELE|nr:hypothetical protein AGOR_G00016120 [Albula goreensis]
MYIHMYLCNYLRTVSMPVHHFECFNCLYLFQEEVDVNVEKTNQNEPSPSAVPIPDSPMPHWKSEELTVSQLLQALRKETDRGDKLELQLQAATERILELEQQTANPVERETQTSLETREGECLKPRLSQSLQEGPGKEVDTLLKELQMVHDTLQRTESTKRTLVDRYQAMEQNLATLENQLMEKEKVLAENQRLKVELESSHNATKMEQKRTEDEKKNKLQLQEAYTRLNEENQRMKEEMKQMPAISREDVSVLQERLDSAENALATKQQKIDEMKQEFFRKDKELEKISVLEAQAEVYKLDFFAEREAREKIHEEKERLAEQLEILRMQHSQLEEKIGRQSLGEIQRRCLTGRGLSGPPAHPQPGARGSLQIPEHACPKCNEVMPDLDSLQIHIMDCID